jgi:hypothetical protein
MATFERRDVTVVVRVRPLLAVEADAGESHVEGLRGSETDGGDASSTTEALASPCAPVPRSLSLRGRLHGRARSWAVGGFARVFSDGADNAAVANALTPPLIEAVMRGGAASLMCYGYTGSGLSPCARVRVCLCVCVSLCVCARVFCVCVCGHHNMAMAISHLMVRVLCKRPTFFCVNICARVWFVDLLACVRFYVRVWLKSFMRSRASARDDDAQARRTLLLVTGASADSFHTPQVTCVPPSRARRVRTPPPPPTCPRPRRS